jgi:hypothetical protein
VPLPLFKAVSRVIRRHGTAPAALLALLPRQHKMTAGRSICERSKDSVRVSLARRADEDCPPLHCMYRCAVPGSCPVSAAIDGLKAILEACRRR